MSPDRVALLKRLRRARDHIDRCYAEPLDVTAMAATVHLSVAHFSRRFAAVYGESPYEYLMTRRIERAMHLLRSGTTVTDACTAVGCTSLGSFSSRFREETGMSPSAYARLAHPAVAAMPSRLAHSVTRPRRSRRVGRGPETEQDRRSAAAAAGPTVVA